MFRNLLLLTFLCSAALCDECAASGKPVPQAIQSTLNTFCADCHSGANPDGGLDLTPAAIDWNGPHAAQTIKRWEDVHTMVSRGIMPPPDSEQPSSQLRSELKAWLDSELIQNSPIGGTPLRRLSRREYANTINSVFGLTNFEVPDSFPPDNKVHGFDSQGHALVMAVSHMEAFADSASLVADQFFAPPRPKIAPQTWSIPAKELVISYSSACLIDGAMRLASSGTNIKRHGTWPERFEAPAKGQYTIEVTVSAFGSPDPAPVLDVSPLSNGNVGKKSLREIPVTGEQPQAIRFDADLDRGESIVMRYTNGPLNYDDKAAYETFLTQLFAEDRRLAAAWTQVKAPARGGSGWERVATLINDPDLDLTQYTPGTEAAVKVIKKMVSNSVLSGETLVYRFFEQGPAVCIHNVSISGPHRQDTDRDDLRIERQRTQLMGNAIDRADPDSLRTFFEGFLTKVFRRTATPAETQAYVNLVIDQAKEQNDLNAALHLAVRTALISPDFLYRNIGPSEMTDVQLANRLSYFLTSGPPDLTLHNIAANGKLKDTAILQKEAKRIVNSRFVQDFTTQWLGLDVLENLMPDARLIKKFTPGHRKTMLSEVQRTFQYILDNNLPVREFIAPDFVFTDQLVGWEIYQLSELQPETNGRKGKKSSKSSNMQQISVPREGRQGGLLSMPAVMMATANGVDTQPVLRGVWMLENILGTPPPDPPNAVPALTPDTAGTSTPKARLAAHMADQNCAVCHRDIDPLGFVLENFDPIGRWRTHYPVYTDEEDQSKPNDGAEVDASGVLPDGVPLNDVTDLKRWLSANPEPFARCLAEKLLTYATGRTLNYRERRVVAEIVREQADNDYRFRDLLLAVIDSEIFRTR